MSPARRVAPTPPNPLSAAEVSEVCEAKRLLSHPGLASRLAHVLGRPIESGLAWLPARARLWVGSATTAALKAALRAALGTMRPPGGMEGGSEAGSESRKAREAHPRRHKLVATLVGGVGGFFGAPALLLELPLSTCIMLRSIADIARSQGEDLGTPEAQLACLEVFALGGVSPRDDSAESGYFAARMALAKAAAEAAEYLATQAVVDEAAPVMLRFMASVAARFQVQVSEKVMAATVPVLGAALGGAVNFAFTSHFQDMARGHFTLRRLERRYGLSVVRAVYEAESGRAQTAAD